QNTNPIPATLPGPDDNANLSRSERALHSNGDMSGTHYDMNLAYMDALFRHLLWTGDLELAKKLWPTIERHLAWERRLFRRERGPVDVLSHDRFATADAARGVADGGGAGPRAAAHPGARPGRAGRPRVRRAERDGLDAVLVVDQQRRDGRERSHRAGVLGGGASRGGVHADEVCAAGKHVH